MSVAAASSNTAPKAGVERAHEPSMEEILASIRRIITEDQPAASKPASVEPRPQRQELPVRHASPTVAELDSAVERLRRALEPMTDRAAFRSRGEPAQAPAQAAPIDLGPPPPPVAETPSPPTEPVAPRTAPAVVIEPPIEAAAPVVQPEPAAAPHSASPFPSLEKAFPGSAPLLQRVANDLPIEAPRVSARPLAESLSRAEILSQPVRAPERPKAPEPAVETEPPPAPAAFEAAAEPETDIAETGFHESAEPIEADSADSLLSPTADASVASSFQALATTVLFKDPNMIEEMAREMLRPMLKQWLDDNLPVMVERLVRSEIERVARGGRS